MSEPWNKSVESNDGSVEGRYYNLAKKADPSANVVDSHPQANVVSHDISSNVVTRTSDITDRHANMNLVGGASDVQHLNDTAYGKMLTSEDASSDYSRASNDREYSPDNKDEAVDDTWSPERGSSWSVEGGSYTPESSGLSPRAASILAAGSALVGSRYGKKDFMSPGGSDGADGGYSAGVYQAAGNAILNKTWQFGRFNKQEVTGKALAENAKFIEDLRPIDVLDKKGLAKSTAKAVYSSVKSNTKKLTGSLDDANGAVDEGERFKAGNVARQIDKPARLAENANRRVKRAMPHGRQKKSLKQAEKAAKAYKKGQYQKSARKLARSQRLQQSRLRNAGRTVRGIGGALMRSKAGMIAVAGLGSLLIVLLMLSAVIACFGTDDEYGNLTDAENQVASFFLSHGLDELHTAAIMGNIYCESGFDPGLLQKPHNCTAPNWSHACAGGGNGHGLFQFDGASMSTGGGIFNVYDLAKQRGLYWTDIDLQCEYVLSILPYTFDRFSTQYIRYADTLGPGYDGISGIGYYMSFEDWKAVTDLDWATQSFEQIYERAGKPWMSNRIDKAWYYYNSLLAAGADGNEAVEKARSQLGVMYSWGGSTPGVGWDCSHLVCWALNIPYMTTYRLIDSTSFETVTDPQPGDICVNNHHVGLYIGNGQMIHAPGRNKVVTIGNVHNDMIYRRYIGTTY